MELVAWIYSGGTIRSNMLHPAFYVGDSTPVLSRTPLDILESALDDVGVGLTVHTPRRRRVARSPRSNDPILVGCMLQATGAPVGRKRGNDQHRLPDWLFDAGHQTQRVFARIYI